MQLLGALDGVVDANLYILSDLSVTSSSVAVAIGLPYTRADGRWEFRFVQLNVKACHASGMVFDHYAGWAIEEATISGNRLRFAGDEGVALDLELDPGDPGCVAIVLLDKYPDVFKDESAEQLRFYMEEGRVTWERLKC